MVTLLTLHFVCAERKMRLSEWQQRVCVALLT